MEAMWGCSSTSAAPPSAGCLCPVHPTFPWRSTFTPKPTSLSWLSSFPSLAISLDSDPFPKPAPRKVHFPCGNPQGPNQQDIFSHASLNVSLSLAYLGIGYRVVPDSVIRAAWTRRSRNEAAKKPNRRSWKQRTDMYMRPFMLSVFFSKRFIHAKVMHRGTSKVISVATTNAKDLRNNLPSLTDHNACRVVGKLIAERSKEADVYAISYDPRKDERIEGKLGIVIDTIKENGIIFV